MCSANLFQLNTWKISPRYNEMGKVARRCVCATCVRSGVLQEPPAGPRLLRINKHPITNENTGEGRSEGSVSENVSKQREVYPLRICFYFQNYYFYNVAFEFIGPYPLPVFSLTDSCCFPGATVEILRRSLSCLFFLFPF